MNSYKEQIWELVLRELEKKYSEPLMDLWFRKLELAHLDDKYAFILSNDDIFFVNLLNTKYAPQITKAFEEIGFDVLVKIFPKKDFSVEGAIFSIESPTAEEENQTETNTEISGDTYKYSGNDISEYDKEYTFENFVVGPSNKLAYAVSMAVAENPSGVTQNHTFERYNPLFLYGSSGLGKTHLMKAIAQRVKTKYPNFKIVFVKGDDFTNELIDSIAKHNMAYFKERFRNVDMLLVDDVQFIGGKIQTQEEFFHTINTLLENHKQIILTSDRPPKEIQHLQDRIKSRFEGGMTADIQQPDPETRTAIIKKKAELMNVHLSNDVLAFIGENIKSNVRQMEGVIKKLGAYGYVTDKPITVEIAREQLSSYISVSSSPYDKAERVIEEVAEIYNVPVEDIKSKKRSKDISMARHVSIFVIRKITKLSVIEIGKIFGRDYSTILASIDVISNKINSNPETERMINELIKEFSTIY